MIPRASIESEEAGVLKWEIGVLAPALFWAVPALSQYGAQIDFVQPVGNKYHREFSALSFGRPLRTSCRSILP